MFVKQLRLERWPMLVVKAQFILRNLTIDGADSVHEMSLNDSDIDMVYVQETKHSPKNATTNEFGIFEFRRPAGNRLTLHSQCCTK